MVGCVEGRGGGHRVLFSWIFLLHTFFIHIVLCSVFFSSRSVFGMEICFVIVEFKFAGHRRRCKHRSKRINFEVKLLLVCWKCMHRKNKQE